VVAYDPVASEEASRMLLAEHGQERCARLLRIVSAADEAVKDADALVLVTEWKEFRSPDFGMLAKTLRERVVFDGRNIWQPAMVTAAGLRYEGIGRIVAAG
jgi:UDPglucose 6-dehydrogenase